MRFNRGLSLDELGRRIDVSGSYLSRVERGFATLSPEKQLALLDALKDSRDDESRIDGKAPAAAD